MKTKRMAKKLLLQGNLELVVHAVAYLAMKGDSIYGNTRKYYAARLLL